MKEYIVAVPEHLEGELFRGDPEVIRCKDCRLYEETNEKTGTCLLTNAGAFPEGFCFWAERKEVQQVRYGHWIDMDEQSYTWKVRCSVCGHERSMMSTQGEYPNYCENCGARMDAE